MLVCPTCSWALTWPRLASAAKTKGSTAVRKLWALVCNIFTVTRCEEFQGFFFSVNLEIHHLLYWNKTVNVFEWLEMLNQCYTRFEDISKARSSCFHECLKCSCVTSASPLPRRVPVTNYSSVSFRSPMSISSTRLYMHAGQTGFTSALWSGRSSGLSCCNANTYTALQGWTTTGNFFIFS